MADTPVFSGVIPRNYDVYMGPVMFDPYGIEAARRLAVSSGMRVLELATGTGRATTHFLDVMPPDGYLLATDLNEDMLTIAKSRIFDARVEYRVMDAQDLTVPDGSFDAVCGQFVLMFLADKEAAMREVFRVLKPGGQLLYMVWGPLEENPASAEVHRYLLETFPDDPPMFLQVPFGFSDHVENHQLASGAGFTDIVVESIRLPLMAESAADYALGLVAGSPLSVMLEQRGITDLAVVAKDVCGRFVTLFGDHPMRCSMEAVLVMARKPELLG